MNSDHTHTSQFQVTPPESMGDRILFFDKLHVFYYLFLPLVGVFSIFNFMSDYMPIAILELILFLLGTATYLFRERINSHVLMQVSVGYISLLFLAFVFLPTVGENAYVWAMGLPYFISYIAGSRASIYWSVSFFIVAIALGVSLFLMGIDLYWSWDIAPYLMMPYVLSAIFAALFARNLEKYLKDFIQAQKIIVQDIKIIEENEARYRTLFAIFHECGCGESKRAMGVCKPSLFKVVWCIFIRGASR
ncbi:MAG: hypothetical protein Q9N62_01030 [Ghiorsea sp.]|nr:hypothetical protein [Ghiorsea sp.]